MNYLAHAYLSFGHSEILLGNMISDFVKGKKQFLYAPPVHKGILLHRAIDDFTDTHAVTQEAKSVFRSAYRLYSGAFIDVVYDHFLALNKKAFPDAEALQDFSQKTYGQLAQQRAAMPPLLDRLFFFWRPKTGRSANPTGRGFYKGLGVW